MAPVRNLFSPTPFFFIDSSPVTRGPIFHFASDRFYRSPPPNLSLSLEFYSSQQRLFFCAPLPSLRVISTPPVFNSFRSPIPATALSSFSLASLAHDSASPLFLSSSFFSRSLAQASASFGRFCRDHHLALSILLIRVSVPLPPDSCGHPPNPYPWPS